MQKIKKIIKIIGGIIIVLIMAWAAIATNPSDFESARNVYAVGVTGEIMIALITISFLWKELSKSE